MYAMQHRMYVTQSWCIPDEIDLCHFRICIITHNNNLFNKTSMYSRSKFCPQKTPILSFLSFCLGNKLHWHRHYFFYMICIGKTKQHRQIRCSGIFWLFRLSGVFRSVMVFRCSWFKYMLKRIINRETQWDVQSNPVHGVQNYLKFSKI